MRLNSDISILWRDRGRMAFLLGLFAVAFGFFVPAAWTGRMFLNAGYLWPPDLFFGMDVARTIHDISQPGHNIRSNVHPYFAPMMKPLSYALQRLGVTAGVSAILLNSAAAALGLMATGLYLRLRGVARTDAVLAVCLMAGSATMVVQGSLPGTFIFSLLFIALGHCLLAWHVRAPDGGTLARVRWGRELIWHITGIMNYGITNSNAFMTWVCYGLAEKEKKRWIRSCLFAVGLIVIGFGLAKLAKSSTDLTLETRWMTNTEDRGGNMPHPFLHSASTSLAWSIVAPMPQHAETMDRRHWHITAFHHWFYTPPDWGLVIIWFGIAGAAIWAAVTDTDPAGRRLTMALIICLLFHIGLHCFYYVNWEGVFGYSGHSLFMVIALLAPLMARMGRSAARTRIACRVMILLFAGVLYGRHNIMLRSLQDTMRLPDYPFPAKMDAAWDPYHLLPPIPSDPQKLAGLILDGARKEVRNKTRYLMEYRELLYPMGDVPSKTGVCTDLIVRAYRNAGIDLQVEVYQDRLAHPSDYPRALHLWEGNIPNSSIDHRRTRNLWVWFKRYAESLPVSSDSASGSDWQPGDIVFFGADRGKSPVHVAIISDAPGSNNLPKLIEARGGVTTDQHDLGGYKPNEIHSHFRITDPSRLPHPPKGTQDRP